jgi:hypothetical protein
MADLSSDGFPYCGKGAGSVLPGVWVSVDKQPHGTITGRLVIRLFSIWKSSGCLSLPTHLVVQTDIRRFSRWNIFGCQMAVKLTAATKKITYYSNKWNCSQSNHREHGITVLKCSGMSSFPAGAKYSKKPSKGPNSCDC